MSNKLNKKFKYNNLNIVIGVVFCIIQASNGCLPEDYKVIRIKQGLVRGLVKEEGYIIEFFGIPYATAPTGDDKFKAPLPPPTWEDTLDATTKNVVCPQRPNLQIPEDNDMRVDCLLINVFTPNTTEKKDKLPVVMYIYGGAYQQGYGNEISPHNLVRQDLIVVNFNYRVGVHGFLCLGTEFAPGNAGLKDQVAALRWIKENIASFGGDPDNVSVAGNSAGASSVEFLMLSKMASGLFHKGLSETGSALSSWAVVDFPLDLAEHYANQFGVQTNRNVTALENFYKTLNIEDLRVSFNSSKIDVIGFTACVENEILGVEPFLLDKPLRIINSGDYNKVPYLTGFNAMEGIFFLDNFDNNKVKMDQDLSVVLPIDVQFKNDEDKQKILDSMKQMYFAKGGINYENYVDFLTDAIFSYAVVTSARLHSKNMPVYFYIFSFNSTVRLPSADVPKLLGPSHGSQALYVQKFSYAVGYQDMTFDDVLIQDHMITMWSDFFKFGNPVPTTSESLPTEWPVFEAEESYFDIDIDMTLKTKPLKERVAFWDSVYEKFRRQTSEIISY